MKRAWLCALALAAGCASSAPYWETSAPPEQALPAPVHSVVAGGAEAWPSVRVAATSIPYGAGNLRAPQGLRFRGGLELRSDDPAFGGLSGLHVDSAGRLLAVSDTGKWFAARLVLDGEGALVGLVDARIASIRDETGAPFADKASADAEGLARLADGRFAVSFERSHVIRVYDLAGKGPNAAPDLTLAPAGTDRLGPNESFEALAAFGDRLIAGTESAPVGAGKGGAFWVVPLDPEQHPGMAGVAPTAQGYGLVSLDRLPNGDFVALERFFAPLIGPRINVKRVSASGLGQTPPAWESTTIAALTPPATLDNFEGVTVVATPEGGVRLYLISDDNFSKAQRTLLYAFDLP
jgi:hypothetical protein